MKIDSAAETFFTSDRGEVALYEAVKPDEQVNLPLTRAGFEAFLARAAGHFSLPIDDSCRKVLCGWIHHVANEQCSTTIETAGKTLYKSLSNALTWTIDQEIKAKQQAEFVAVQAKAKAEAEEVAKQKAVEKRQKKSNRYSVKQKSDEAETN